MNDNIRILNSDDLKEEIMFSSVTIPLNEYDKMIKKLELYYLIDKEIKKMIDKATISMFRDDIDIDYRYLNNIVTILYSDVIEYKKIVTIREREKEED